jgi:hypothetical protein
MAEHESSIGNSDDWFTPPEIFAALKLKFDLDPCSPCRRHWVPARKVFTKRDDGLRQRWRGLVFMNPPFGGREGHVPWLEKFLDHGNGIAIVRAYTSAGWFHDLIPRAESLLFPRGKTQFIRGTRMRSETANGVKFHAKGSRGKSPGHGVVFIGMGARANRALKACGLGIYIEL